jgi:hypothetical protein
MKRMQLPTLEDRVIHRILTLRSLLTDVLRDQLYRLGTMDEDAAECLQRMLRDVRAEHELLCVRPERLDMGRHTV